MLELVNAATWRGFTPRMAPQLLVLCLLAVSCSALKPEPVTVFKVTITNVSDKNSVNTVISTGVAVTHNDALALFKAGTPDSGLGLEGVAEDGNKWTLNRNMTRSANVYDQVIFDTPVGGMRPENIGPPKRYEFLIAAKPSFPFLSLSSMVGFTNDVNLMLDTNGRSGFSLFREDGTPKTDEDLRQVVMHWDVWDQGTEINEVNGIGPHQPDAPSGLNVGPSDVGVVRVYEDVERPIDPANSAFAVELENVKDAPEGTVRLTIVNNSNAPGLTPTALGPVVVFAHDPSFSMFELGTADKGQGLETLAEDGDPSSLIASLSKHPGYGSHARSGDTQIGPGQRVSIEIRLTSDHPEISCATMYVESNDTFLTFVSPHGQSGLRLHGQSDEYLARSLATSVQLVESGTEWNEAIGKGKNQGARQRNPGQGEPDKGVVRRWRVPTNPIVAAWIAKIEVRRADGVKYTLPIPRSSRRY